MNEWSYVSESNRCEPWKNGLSEANSREELLVWGWGIIIAYSKIYLMESEVELGCRVTSRLN